MDIKYNTEKLKETLKDVYTLLKTPISIFDRDLNCIVSNDKMTEYCTMIRSSEGRYAKCRASDSEACTKCKDSGEAFSYLCHGGVHETITPIRYGKHLLGYIIFGQYRMESNENSVVRYAEENGMDADAFLAAYRSLPVLTQEQIDAVCHILESCILRFTLSDAITLRESDLAERIRAYVADHLAEKITADALCRTFLLNREQLYAVFRQNFNMTVKEYVLSEKLAYAKHLLKNTQDSVTVIAETCGFPDYNNFIQRFKQHVGTTPLKYRKG